MKFSAQEEYGLRCLISLARQADNHALTIPEISRIEGITPPHAAKILAELRRAGMVKATRGMIGGYTLSRPPSEISVGDALDALGGRLFEHGFCDRYSGTQNSCAHETDCNLRSLWGRIQGAIDGVVYRLTLQDLVEGGEELTPNRMYLTGITRRPKHDAPPQ